MMTPALASAPLDNQSSRVQFYVASVSCIACNPVFRKGLRHSKGIRNVRELPMFNKIVVEFDPAKTNEETVRGEILEVAERAGLKGKVVIPRRNPQGR